MNIPAPEPRQYKPRVTDEHRAMQPGDSVLVSKAVAQSLRSMGRHRGWRTVQRAEGKLIRVWRIEDAAK